MLCAAEPLRRRYALLHVRGTGRQPDRVMQNPSFDIPALLAITPHQGEQKPAPRAPAP